MKWMSMEQYFQPKLKQEALFTHNIPVYKYVVWGLVPLTNFYHLFLVFTLIMSVLV